MTEENGRQNALDEVRRANEVLAEAEALRGLEMHNGAAERAYFVAFHWARALLVTQGFQPRTHQGVQQLVGLHFVRTGALSDEATRLLHELQEGRESCEYLVQMQATSDEARDAIAKARRVAELCRPLLPFLPNDAWPQ